jgi:diguanylate cyclase (GGDEF)-like protein
MLLSGDHEYTAQARRGFGRAGFSSIATSSEFQALEIVRAIDVDALLCDVQLPHVDGFAFCRDLSRRYGDQAPPSLLLGDKVSLAMRAKVSKCGGALGVYPKSRSLDGLVERVRAMIGIEPRRAFFPRRSASKLDRIGENVDPLTGVLSRQGFDRLLDAEIIHAFFAEKPLGLLLIAPDGFDDFVREHGRFAADAVLSRVALVLKSEVRSRDTVARYSDKFFAVILPETPLEGVGAVARRLNYVLADTEFGDLDHPFSFVFSIGVSWRERAGGTVASQLCEEALAACLPS